MIEVYADIWCPFAYVGLHAALERERSAPLLIHPWPLELVNGQGLSPETTLRHVHELREQVAPDLFADFRVDRFPSTTLPALALVMAGYRVDAARGEALSVALREALFEEGRDIADDTTLGEIARAHDVQVTPADDAEVLTQYRAGQVRGVKGSPHFFCGDTDAFCPTLDITRDATDHLLLRANAARLDAFLDACALDAADH